jgi:hypothetical protein
MPILSASAAGAQPVAVGVEFQVNLHTSGTQRASSVAMDQHGAFAVVWTAYGQDGNGAGVFGRRYVSSGGAVGGEFQVNTTTTSYQRYPSIAMEPDGDFVVAWESNLQDGYGYGVVARRFASTGAPSTAEILINTFTVGQQHDARVALDGAGDFVVVWQSDGQDGYVGSIWGRRFNAAGAAQGPEFPVNSTVFGEQRNAAIGAESNGDFVVVWQSGASQDGSDFGIFGQRFTSSGSHVGAEFLVNDKTEDGQRYPEVAVDGDGDFVVTWASSDGQDYDIYGRRFDSSGVPQGPHFLVNTTFTGSQEESRVAMDAKGDFIVVWGDQGSGDVFARSVTASGLTQLVAPVVNTFTAGIQAEPAVGVDTAGDFVVAWSSYLQDGSLLGVFGRRFDVGTLIDVDGDGAFAPLTDGLLLLRFGFGFTGATLITGAIGPGCTRCDAASITAYLTSLL